MLQNKSSHEIDPEALLQQALRWSAEARSRRDAEHLQPVVLDLEAWQKQRLQRSYADLSDDDRYTSATEFFSDELYAPPDLASRDNDIRRMAPMLVRMLPAAAVDTVASALGLQALTLELDVELASCTLKHEEPGQTMNDEVYARNYRRVGRREDRSLQLDLILRVGSDLDRLVGNRFIYTTLRLSRPMAQLAGLASLQQFLEHGFRAFRAMNGAGHFLRTIEQRERRIMEQLFAGDVPNFDAPTT